MKTIHLSIFLAFALFVFNFIGCSEPYPDAYGVYLEDGKTLIPRIDFDEKMLSNINKETLPIVEEKPLLILWFYDPRIVPTQLKFGRLAHDIDDAVSISFKTTPIEGKTGLYKVEIPSLKPGMYAFFLDNAKGWLAENPDIEWPFIVK